MKAIPYVMAAGLGLILTAPAMAQDNAAPESTPPESTTPETSAPPVATEENASTMVRFVNGEGDETGTAKLTSTSEGVLLELDLNDLPASQWVAVHFHETGQCDPEGHFESAGGHFNPTDHEHGYLSASGPHAGDMPNQYVNSEGTLRAQIFNSFVTLGGGDADVTGHSLMIHAGKDDYQSQPSGDAGDRYACAVIE